MNKHIMLLIVGVFVLLFVVNAEAAVSKRYYKDKSTSKSHSITKSDESVVRSEAGLNIKDWGIAIDAIFDPRLDSLITDYHIVNIVLTNRRGEPIVLDARRDKWYVIDSLGKKHTAYNHVRQFDSKLWKKMPKKMQDMLEYPHMVRPGKSTNIDVFISKDVDLFHFREIVWQSEHFDKEFNVFTNYEKNLAIPLNTKEFELPKKSTAEQDLILEQKNNEQRPNSKYAKPQPLEQNTSPQALEVNDLSSKQNQTPKPSVEGFVRVK